MAPTRIAWLLFYLTLAVALGLGLAVLLAPLLESWNLSQSSLIRLFANDVTVRRTSLGAAVGLAVTAYLCFRPKPKPDKPPGQT